MSSEGSSRRSPSSQKSGLRYWSQGGASQVNPRSIVARLETVGGTGDSYGDDLPELPLPGHGERYGDCGDDIPRFCSDCGHIQTAGRTCYRSGCPRCWKGWDRRRSTTITSKLEALRSYKESARDGWDGWKFHHVAFSPPEGYAVNSDNPLQHTFDVIKEVSAELGAETGYLFYHPYRGDNGDDKGFWKDVLPDGEEVDMADTRAKLSAEPHFHAVLLSKHVDGGFATKAIEAKTGWVVERITKEDGSVSIYDKFDLARVVTYCLSHTGIGEDRAEYRAFGEVANFQAYESIERKMGAAVRSVAPNTLGLAYRSVMCLDERMNPIGDPDEKVVPDAYTAEGDGDDPDEIELEEEECAGRMLDIKKAPRYLEDSDWMAEAPNAADLVDAWEQWRHRVDTPPDD